GFGRPRSSRSAHRGPGTLGTRWSLHRMVTRTSSVCPQVTIRGGYGGGVSRPLQARRSLSARATGSGSRWETSPPSLVTSRHNDDETNDRSERVGRNTVSTPEI